MDTDIKKKEKYLINIPIVAILFLKIIFTSLFQNLFSTNIVSDLKLTFPIIFLALYFFSFLLWPTCKVELYFFIFIAFICLLSRKSYIITVFSLVLLFSRLQLIDIINDYKFATILGILVTSISSLLGIISLHGITGNGSSVLTFGFANENTFGFFITFLAILFLLKYDGSFYVSFNLINTLFFFFVFFINIFSLEDNSTAVVMIIFLLASKIKLKINNLTEILVGIVPPLLLWLSFFFALNYNRYYFIQELNRIITNRFIIWNYYLNHFSFNLFGNNINFGLVNFFGGAFDGSYIYYTLNYGIVIMFIWTLGLMFANILLLRYKNQAILAILLAFEVYAFTENLPFDYQSFVILIAMLSWMPGYLSNS
ncbi:hypothetical protein [Limosilactobacillus vaginalis]|uniref:hypothetical protein n=1 Tax=Limosilactobacillus vaginalis TaxID=1633 RepID=UPI0025A3EFC3|nr:hypothetical protein [Limosilactobacillus vaginalis]MDM8222234.1 hypothetical protein [Limosilactobacillus vaginalis]MDM8264761.1 hypothetical protein [Limosilactobacillus vaginalis]